VVENRAGSSGNVGSDSVAKAPPDGYTLLVGGMNTHAINLWLYRDLPFDPVRDFTPIAPIAWSPSVLLVQASSGIASLADLVARAREKPGTLAFASAGVGVPGHLNVEWIKSITGIELGHVPYKGEADAVLALLRGDVVLASAAVPTAAPHVKAGRLRAIAIAADRRSPTMPDVPTVGETFPGVGSGSWIALFGPAGLPGDVVRRVNDAVDRFLRSPEIASRMAESDLTHVSMTPPPSPSTRRRRSRSGARSCAPPACGSTDAPMRTTFGEALRRHAHDAAAPAALVGTDGVVSYGALVERVERCAAWLAARGMRAGVPVAVSVGDETSALVASLALLDLGLPQVGLGTTTPGAMRDELARRIGVGRVVVDDPRHALPASPSRI
jgi:tripartite-type tricarboxylate transporter receptor subunit TctC